MITQKKTKVNGAWRLIILFCYIILGVSFQNYLSETQILIFALGIFVIFAWVCTGVLAEDFPDEPQFTQEVKDK